MSEKGFKILRVESASNPKYEALVARVLVDLGNVEIEWDVMTAKKGGYIARVYCRLTDEVDPTTGYDLRIPVARIKDQGFARDVVDAIKSAASNYLKYGTLPNEPAPPAGQEERRGDIPPAEELARDLPYEAPPDSSVPF